MKIQLISLFLFFAYSVNAQVEYRTLKKVTDSTFVEQTVSDTEESAVLTLEQALSAFFRTIDNYHRLKNKKFQEEFTINRIVTNLERDVITYFPDTSYLDYNKYQDTVYSNPARTGIYASQLQISQDTTLYLEFFRAANGAQIFRIQGDITNTNYPARFMEGSYTLRLGSLTKYIDQLGGPVDLHYYATQNERVFKNYIRKLDNNKIARLRLKVR